MAVMIGICGKSNEVIGNPLGVYLIVASEGCNIFIHFFSSSAGRFHFDDRYGLGLCASLIKVVFQSN